MGISFKEALQNGLVSSKTLEIIPNKCRCGASLELNDSLRELKCVDKDCIYIIVDRLISFCNKTNTDIKNNELKELTIKLNIVTPYQLLMLDEVYSNNIINRSDIQNIDEVIQNIKNIKNNDYFIYNIAELCGIVNIEKVAYKLFSGFNSFEEAFEEIEIGQVSFINERLGIQDTGCGSFQPLKSMNSQTGKLHFYYICWSNSHRTHPDSRGGNLLLDPTF